MRPRPKAMARKAGAKGQPIKVKDARMGVGIAVVTACDKIVQPNRPVNLERGFPKRSGRRITQLLKARVKGVVEKARGRAWQSWKTSKGPSHHWGRSAKQHKNG